MSELVRKRKAILSLGLVERWEKDDEEELEREAARLKRERSSRSSVRGMGAEEWRGGRKRGPMRKRIGSERRREKESTNGVVENIEIVLRMVGRGNGEFGSGILKDWVNGFREFGFRFRLGLEYLEVCEIGFDGKRNGREGGSEGGRGVFVLFCFSVPYAELIRSGLCLWRDERESTNGFGLSLCRKWNGYSESDRYRSGSVEIKSI